MLDHLFSGLVFVNTILELVHSMLGTHRKSIPLRGNRTKIYGLIDFAFSAIQANLRHAAGGQKEERGPQYKLLLSAQKDKRKQDVAAGCGKLRPVLH